MMPGGAQRVIAQLCDHFVAHGHDTTLVTLEPESAEIFFPVSDGVRLMPLGRISGPVRIGRVWRTAKWLRRIRRAIVSIRPDVVISFIDLTNILVLMATRGLDVPVIVSERNDPHHHAIGGIASAMRRITYPSAARIVVQTDRAAQFFTRYPASKLVILPNPVSDATAGARPAEGSSNGRWRIIGVGRLDPQKGFDLLVKAFARLATRFPGWDVVIFGRGPERAALLAAVETHRLTGRVVVAAPTTRVAAELAASHVFALPSRYEGFPNALAEAMAAGLPAIGFADVSGVEDLIEPNRNGLLAAWGTSDEDAVQSLAACLASLMASAELRVQLGAAAAAGVRKFAPDGILAAWDQLVADVLREAKPK
jgi:GalNAc-alpha-(1->4)-GalNAc-alpha-(1->3)-diNAcBac-PP-undecaprenol alpha-1,4-N-acetyl-D-galactosaminyltransferase